MDELREVAKSIEKEFKETNSAVLALTELRVIHNLLVTNPGVQHDGMPHEKGEHQAGAPHTKSGRMELSP